MKSRILISKLARGVMPFPLWNAVQRARGLPQSRPFRRFGRIGTEANPSAITDSRYSAVLDKHHSLDPIRSKETLRYMMYNVCAFGLLCRDVPGDFVFAGVSWGVAPRMVFDYADLQNTDKNLHLIDPFDARQDGKTAASYNADPHYVLRQYPVDAKVVLHRRAIPIDWDSPIAFLYSDTGSPSACAESLPLFWDRLNNGGIILCEQYSQPSFYKTAISKIGVEPTWLPSGQGLFVKR